LSRTPIPAGKGEAELFILLSAVLGILLLASCSPLPTAAPTENASPTATQLPPTASLTPNPSTTPRITPIPATATLTPVPSLTFTPSVTPPPPPQFTSKILRPDVAPQSYLEPCKYLSLRWSPGNSSPDTVVVPIMFHGIVKSGHPVENSVDISTEQFLGFVSYAHYLGYETITTSQLVNFLENNALIPRRSMIMIIDDRRPGTVREHFMPVLQENNWTLTLGYISGVVPDSEWADLEDMAKSGRLDVQAHGWLHNADTYIQDTTPEDVIRQEIFKPIPVLQQHFGYRPTAFIWPGGDYNTLGVQIAREAEYKIGFTANSRGPLLFNWIPLGAPEQAMNDPLMVLPRYWSNEAGLALDIGIKAGQEAGAYAAKDYRKEANWYRGECGGELPPMPTAVATP
jgi:peptidoglycan/xylan/chitin deacetylase (PgdA/CDA1 family)